MKPRKKGLLYEISYRCTGYKQPFFERFVTIEEANLRCAQITYEKSLGKFHPPSQVFPQAGTIRKKSIVTVSDLMDEYVQMYGLNNWGDSYLSSSQHRIEHYIKPYIGDVAIRDLTTHDLDVFYTVLQEKPAVILKGHKKTDATVSLSVIEKTHSLLRNALKQAVKWEYIKKNPADNVTLPQYKCAKRDVWSTSEAQYALDCCTDPVLYASMVLALGCSMRIGEILGLTWDCVDYSDESLDNGEAHLCVTKELKRCQKDSLEALARRGRSKVLFTFPEWKKTSSTTSLVLKTPKTDSSVRNIYLPRTVALVLRDVKASQDEIKEQLGDKYQDFNLVIAHPDGRPYEERQIADMLRAMIEEHNLPPVVFHSLRHCSASLKLKIGGGNIKAVQGDTGHAQAKMVTELYAHTHNEDRQRLARKVEEDFFMKRKGVNKNTADDEATAAYQLLQNNPDIAKLIIATLQAKATI